MKQYEYKNAMMRDLTTSSLRELTKQGLDGWQIVYVGDAQRSSHGWLESAVILMREITKE